MNFSLVVRLLLVLSISSIFYSFTYIKDQPYVVILGVAQDGGAPHAACEKSCCIHKWNDPTLHNKVSSIGIVDPLSNEVWMIDATPDFAEQLHLLTNNNSIVYTIIVFIIFRRGPGGTLGLAKPPPVRRALFSYGASALAASPRSGQRLLSETHV